MHDVIIFFSPHVYTLHLDALFAHFHLSPSHTAFLICASIITWNRSKEEVVKTKSTQSLRKKKMNMKTSPFECSSGPVYINEVNSTTW